MNIGFEIRDMYRFSEIGNVSLDFHEAALFCYNSHSKRMSWFVFLPPVK
jgi:hypothetical protein